MLLHITDSGAWERKRLPRSTVCRFCNAIPLYAPTVSDPFCAEVNAEPTAEVNAFVKSYSHVKPSIHFVTNKLIFDILTVAMKEINREIS